MKKEVALSKFEEVIRMGILYECSPADIANQLLYEAQKLGIQPPAIKIVDESNPYNGKIFEYHYENKWE